MKNIILCEGSTDYVLLQYYMRAAHQWKDGKEGMLKMPGQKSRDLVKNNDILTLMAVGGCSQMGNGLRTVLEKNKLSPPDLLDAYGKIVIITDRDEVGTEQNFIKCIQEILKEYNVSFSPLVNDTWIECTMYNQVGVKVEFLLLFLIVPFDENGALETFLLNAVAHKDVYDKVIIDECNDLVDRVDPEKRYLSSRRYITKAKFDTYFSVRTPVEQFRQRQDILKNVKWEQYDVICSTFKKLSQL